MPIGCVILAAGNSTRFGRNKLFTEINGKTMIVRAFASVPAEKLRGVVVVTQYEDVRRLAESFGFFSIVNSHPEWGLSHSVRLGTEALKDQCGGILYQVADQPWLKRESVCGMLDVFCEHPDSIVAMSSNGKRGNPCIFPKAFFDELCALSGDKGGRAVIEHHEDRLLLFEVSAEELADIDTPEDIDNINEELGMRNEES
ncbi:MAG: nucleotidyltransferase family protein [Ruminococcus sp.]|nr:nucleotidyltransferase family protein [Ruminococcus sp.]